MKKTIFLVFLLLINKQIFSQADSSYFPLQKGNQWEYNNGYRYFYGQIERDTLINGKFYFVLPSSISDFRFVRTDSIGNIYSLGAFFSPSNTRDSIEALILKKKSQLNDQWIVTTGGYPLPDTVRARCIYNDSGIVFGKYRKITGIKLTFKYAPFINYHFAQGIGVIRTEYDDGTMVLINYAKIDNNVYGKILNITDKEKLLSKFEISQNFPNPFNSTTSIDIQLPKDMKNHNEVEFYIYDMLGKILFRNEYPIPIDQQKFRINLDISHLRLPSGTYYYTLKSDEFTIAKKMIYLK